MTSTNAIHIYDFVVASIGTNIALDPPERAGALLGPAGKSCVSQFIIDDEASTTGTSFIPSSMIERRVQATELSSGREFKGLVHSHPGALDCLSSQDLISIERALDCNPHLASYIAPIVTLGGSDGPLASHELSLCRGKISFFRAQRGRDGAVMITSPDIHSVPVETDLTLVAHHYDADREPECFLSNLGPAEIAVGCVVLPDQTEIMVMVSELYPATPPLVLFTDDAGNAQQLHVPWRIDIAAKDRLLTAISELVPLGGGRLSRGYGPSALRRLTTDATSAAAGGWQFRWYRVPADETPISEEIALGIQARNPGASSFADASALIVGAGSVGSVAAEQLVRAGIARVAVIDPGAVEAKNLSRAAYEAQDLGSLKVNALHRRMLNINPGVTFEPIAQRVQAIAPSRLLQLCEQSTVVVVATDDPQTQIAINRFTYSAGTPAVFIGLFDHAEGGEVIFTCPDDTACYLCAATNRADIIGEAVEPSLDYSTGRLAGVRAFAADIHLVVCAGIKIALSLIDAADGQTGFLDGPLTNGQTYVFFALTPGFLFFPTLFANTPSQHAYQTVWARPTRITDCPVCGSQHGREDPLAHPLESPSVADVLRAMETHPRE
jgi:molybdopterin/thiamine biosynthesis adenylyltransferase/proteasome lid subunit RPN8/RPN11